jgi:16S rRNA (adenine(1408)-N(1))-methyltransferase
MKILSRKRLCDIDLAQLTARIGGRCPIHVDVGTGSGKLILESAKNNSEGYYIGLDPCAERMYENATRAAKQEKKQAFTNLLYVVASVEALPEELSGIADTVSVILPWGSLRDGIAKAEPAVLANIRKLGKPGTVLTIFVGYEESREPLEMVKSALPVLSRDYFKALTPAYSRAGIRIRRIETIGNNELKHLESDWAKKLAYGVPRQFIKLEGVYI